MADDNAVQNTLDTLAASLKALQASVEANAQAFQHLHEAQKPPYSTW